MKTENYSSKCLVLTVLIASSMVECLAQDYSGAAWGPAAGGGGNASSPAGSSAFQTDPFSGRFTYSVPIKVAPGRQGTQPHLSLNYKSDTANGWCGVGWSLEVGYIERQTSKGVPIPWSVTNSLAVYDDSKGFVVNIGGLDEKLVCVGATNQNPVVYRLRGDRGFATYNYYTNNHWEVVDKSGNTYFFGESLTNRMENSKPGWVANAGLSTFRWALDKSIDVNGNETFYNYAKDGGLLYLANISYNANTNSPVLSATHVVTFILTNRPDTNISFSSGYRITTQKRLTEIDVTVSGTNVARYVLGYTNSPSTMRSLLSAVTEYGSDYTTSLPPMTFNYQVQPFQFGAATNWGPVSGQGYEFANDYWGAPEGVSKNATYQTLVDINGDGLPDRVMVNANQPVTRWVVQTNTGSGFGPTSSWNNLHSPVANNQWNSIEAGYYPPVGCYEKYVELLDIDGDGLPDRVMGKGSAPYTNFVVQLNNGTNFDAASNWGPVNGQGYESIDDWWGAPEVTNLGGESCRLIDINGDGLPDRVMVNAVLPVRYWMVQLNNGHGFGITNTWNSLQSSYTNNNWNSITANYFGGPSSVVQETFVDLIDINGDGLPDRVMRRASAPFDRFVVQFNNGVGFEPAEDWGPVSGQGYETVDDWWGTPRTRVQNISGGTTFFHQDSTLVDINGDGLPDRVMIDANPPVQYWVVQLNTGSGFGPTNIWNSLHSPISGNDWNSIEADYNFVSFPDVLNETYVQLMDINGDGLPDRVMGKGSAPYTNFVVQFNQGPFPDLLNVVSNGIGGTVRVAYSPSTSLDNFDSSHAKGLLPFNVWVVSQTAVSDGLGNVSTNTYAYKGGFFNATNRELRGFSQVTATDPLGTKTTTYFHQSGGKDNTALGEFMDQGSVSKAGFPFRIEVVGSDGFTNAVTLNKVEEVTLHTNGWYFPFVSQSIIMSYEGLNSYRAVATQYGYDTNTGNPTFVATLGEVTNVVVNGQSFTDIRSDAAYAWTTYATNLGTILNKPVNTKVTSDSAGSTRLRESLQSYDSHGRMTNAQEWLDSASSFVSLASTAYDQYGNPIQSTDAAGITTTSSYDSTFQQYPILQVTGSFTNQAAYDPRGGMVLMSIDAKGLVASNVFDVLYRKTATYVSTNPYSTATLWKSKASYTSGGISNGVSLNCVHSQAFDAVDLSNGYETFTYADGLGRTIETRAEAENGQFRVVNSVMDRRGNPYYETLPYFSSGTGFTVVTGTNLGKLTEYDAVGRAFRGTPAVQGVFDASGHLMSTNSTGGDIGSPVGAATTAFVDGSNPWAIVVTDSEGKVRKTYRDAYGRNVVITEVTSGGNYNTSFAYDLLGNLTNITDHAGSSTGMAYDSFERKISMVDPDMGTWSYAFDNASRPTQQADARGNTAKFYYNDQLGRLTSKEFYNVLNHLVGTVSYAYDASDDTNYTVFKGQLYKVVDSQGYERNSYDVRGRVLKTGRFLNLNASEYVIQATYDDADRVQQLVYPGNAATIQYSYDTGGNTQQIKSLAGTGSQELFFTALGFDQAGRLLGYTNGNGVLTTNLYYANSKRPQRVQVGRGTNSLQDLSYTYDTVANLKSINDRVYAGSSSASLTNILYDDLHRLTSLNSTARGVKTYGYNPIGNILTNQDNGPGGYLYGAKPHAVTNANGITYGYDACGNMTARGSQTLVYDEQNQLVQVSATNMNVTFGYDDGGERLWRKGTNGYTIWIGGIYEINNGKVLCHVLGDGGLIATFEPQCNALMSKVFGEKSWYSVSTAVEYGMAWPFQRGRSFWTIFVGTWVGILGLCWMLGRGTQLRRPELRRAWRPSSLWRQAVTLLTLAAYLAAGTGNVEAATYTPVFYYYHCNHLGSSNVLTDRAGLLVQHYEQSTYGQTTFSDNNSAFPVSNRYTGQICDDETGLYYYGARYYDPGLGRFIQPDTEVPDPTDPQTLNPYAYANNNPLRYIDPTGHWDEVATDDLSFSGPLAGFSAAVLTIRAVNTYVGYVDMSALMPAADPNSTASVGNSSPPGEPSVFDMWVSDTASRASIAPPAQPSPQAASPSVAATSETHGGWVATATNIAGWVSMLPGPIGAVAGIANAVGEGIQGHKVAMGIALATAAFSLFGAGIVGAGLKRSAAKLVRYGSEAEAVATKNAGKLLPRPAPHGWNEKWVGLDGSIDYTKLGSTKNYTHKITITLKRDARSWLDEIANARTKPNELDRWGIRPQKLNEFNSMIDSVKIEKIR
jgi:RHS repeat-associated protein